MIHVWCCVGLEQALLSMKHGGESGWQASCAFLQTVLHQCAIARSQVLLAEPLCKGDTIVCLHLWRYNKLHMDVPLLAALVGMGASIYVVSHALIDVYVPVSGKMRQHVGCQL